MRESLRDERELMAPIRKLADVVIDTTQFNVHELRHFITERFKNPDKRPMLVSVVSFGYRYGVPTDADLVFDVRFLPNPHFVPRLRQFTGKDRQGRALHSFVSADRRIFAAHRKPARLSDSALYPRGQKLSDHRLRLHRRTAPLGDDGRRDEEGAWKSARYAAKVVHRDSKSRGSLAAVRVGAGKLDTSLERRIAYQVNRSRGAGQLGIAVLTTIRSACWATCGRTVRLGVGIVAAGLCGARGRRRGVDDQPGV